MRELDPRALYRLLPAIARLIRTVIGLISIVAQYSVIRHRPARALAAENLFLRRQLALLREREVKPRRADAYGRPSRAGCAQAVICSPIDQASRIQPRRVTDIVEPICNIHSVCSQRSSVVSTVM